MIPALYGDMDAIVGETLQRLRARDLLVVMSDHGFASWRRSFNLNSWLRDHGYLQAAAPPNSGNPGLFNGVDWRATRAYGLGLNGLYVNLKGREVDGSVDPAQRESLLVEAVRRAVADGSIPRRVCRRLQRVFRREQAYASAGQDDIAP